MSSESELEIMARRAEDPTRLGWPVTLPTELALRRMSPQDIRQAYGIDDEEWDRLRYDPVFLADLKEAMDALRKDGMRFKTKARLQAEELLETSWKLIHSPNDQVAPAVKADLIKFTVRAAGLDGSKDQVNAALAQAALQINLVLT